MANKPATEILDATYHVLSDQGYADLTLRDIAVEADTSKASIHYHYGSKDQLFVAFLDELYERFTERVESPAGDTPHEQLDTLLRVLLTTTDTDPALKEFRTVMLELKAQAPYNPTLQERLAKFDEFLFEQLRELLAAGVNSAEFEEVEPARAAEFITATITGAHTRHAAIDQSTDRLYATMTRYLERQLVAHEQPEVAP